MFLDFSWETTVEKRRTDYVIDQIALRVYLSPLHVYRCIRAFQNENQMELLLFNPWEVAWREKIFTCLVRNQSGWEFALLVGGAAIDGGEGFDTQKHCVESARRKAEETIEKIRSRLGVIVEEVPVLAAED